MNSHLLNSEHQFFKQIAFFHITLASKSGYKYWLQFSISLIVPVRTHANIRSFPKR